MRCVDPALTLFGVNLSQKLVLMNLACMQKMQKEKRKALAKVRAEEQSKYDEAKENDASDIKLKEMKAGQMAQVRAAEIAFEIASINLRQGQEQGPPEVIQDQLFKLEADEESNFNALKKTLGDKQVEIHEQDTLIDWAVAYGRKLRYHMMYLEVEADFLDARQRQAERRLRRLDQHFDTDRHLYLDLYSSTVEKHCGEKKAKEVVSTHYSEVQLRCRAALKEHYIEMDRLMEELYGAGGDLDVE